MTYKPNQPFPLQVGLGGGVYHSNNNQSRAGSSLSVFSVSSLYTLLCLSVFSVSSLLHTALCLCFIILTSPVVKSPPPAWHRPPLHWSRLPSSIFLAVFLTAWDRIGWALNNLAKATCSCFAGLRIERRALCVQGKCSSGQFLVCASVLF